MNQIITKINVASSRQHPCQCYRSNMLVNVNANPSPPVTQSHYTKTLLHHPPKKRSHQGSAYPNIKHYLTIAVRMHSTNTGHHRRSRMDRQRDRQTTCLILSILRQAYIRQYLTRQEYARQGHESSSHFQLPL